MLLLVMYYNYCWLKNISRRAACRVSGEMLSTIEE